MNELILPLDNSQFLIYSIKISIFAATALILIRVGSESLSVFCPPSFKVPVSPVLACSYQNKNKGWPSS